MATTRTVQQLLTMAFQELGVAATGEPVDSEDLMYGIKKFNDFIDQLAAYRLTIWELIRQTVNIASGATSYTIGSGGDIDIQRPEQILRAGLVNIASNPTDPLETRIKMLTDEQWSQIGLKSMTSNIAWAAWYRSSVPLGKLYIYPILTASQQLALYVPTAMDEVVEDESGLATNIVTPRGWRKMLTTNMALEVADYFHLTPSANLVRRASIAMQFVTRANAKPMSLQLPAGLPRGKRRSFNILTGQ